jgi:hypothetical protein
MESLKRTRFFFIKKKRAATEVPEQGLLSLELNHLAALTKPAYKGLRWRRARVDALVHRRHERLN